MIIVDNHLAVIDADFYIKMTKYAADKGALFLQLMEDLGVQPVMHKFVADIELKKDIYSGHDEGGLYRNQRLRRLSDY